MSQYYLVSRDLKGYTLDSNSVRDLKEWIEGHPRQSYYHMTHLIVGTKPRAYGFSFTVRRFSCVPFWPPRFSRGSPSLEVFHLSIRLRPEYYDRWDHIEFDPLGEFPKGMSIKAAKKLVAKKDQK